MFNKFDENTNHVIVAVTVLLVLAILSSCGDIKTVKKVF